MTRKMLAACLLWLLCWTQAGSMRSTVQAEIAAAGRSKTSSSASSRRTASATARVNPKLAAKVRRVLDSYYRKPLNTSQDSPWSLLHWGIAFGQDSRVVTGVVSYQPTTAIQWLCDNRPAAGKQLFDTRADGLSLPIAPGLQGHHGQFLSMLAQSDVAENHPLHVNDTQYQVRDLIAHEKRTCESGMELTFKLTGIAHYTPSEQVWKNQRDETWSVRRLLVEELDQPINRMACCCGGTHRLFAWNYAVERRRAEGQPIDGPWATAAARVRAYQRRAFQFQNRDGSFSTMWLDRPENSPELTRSLTTTGHVLEWMIASLPDSQLQDPRLARAVNYVADVLEENQQNRWHRGALGHSLHALSIYEQRVLGARPGARIARSKTP